MLVGTTEMAGLLGITPRQLTSLRDQEVIPDAGRGQWDVAETFQAYVKHKVRSEVSRSQRPVSNADEELKQIRIQRERRKNDVEERLLLPLEDALFHIDEFVGLVLLEINNVPARFTRDIDQRDKLQEAIDEALHAVADGVEKCGQALRARRSDDPPEAPDDDGDDD